MIQSLPILKIGGLFTLVICALSGFSCSDRIQNESDSSFNHVMLYVSDMEQSVSFYEQAFGMSVYQRIGEVVVQTGQSPADTVQLDLVMLKLPGSAFILELSERVVPNSLQSSPHFQHLGIEVRDIEAAFDQAIKFGAQQQTNIRTLSTDQITARNVFLRGPDSELIELIEIMKGDF